MRGAIWLLALLGIVLLPGFGDTSEPPRVEISSR
jgi:hypothetical protein